MIIALWSLAAYLDTLIWEMWSGNNLLLRQFKSPSGNWQQEYSSEDDILAFQKEPEISTEDANEEYLKLLSLYLQIFLGKLQYGEIAERPNTSLILNWICNCAGPIQSLQACDILQLESEFQFRTWFLCHCYW